MAKKRRKRQSHRRKKDELNSVYVSEYTITTEPIEDRNYKRLPDQVKDAISRLHQDSQRRPHKAIPELLELIEQYPQMPIFYNFLSIAYSTAGQLEQAKAVTEENYRQNPDYLFARLNYAELCLAKGDYERVAEIFEHKFDLKQLYPKRKEFHVSEVVNFMGIVGVYFFEIGERESAKQYYDALTQIGPGYPMTKRLRRKLYPGPLLRLWRRLAGRAS